MWALLKIHQLNVCEGMYLVTTRGYNSSSAVALNVCSIVGFLFAVFFELFAQLLLVFQIKGFLLLYRV